MTTPLLPGSWEIVSLLCKFFLYVGVASIAGGSFCLWQFCDGRRQSVFKLLVYIALGVFIGFQSVWINFLAQVGQLNGSGFMGMFDWGMASILLDTSLGQVTLYRLLAFTWALLASLAYLRKLHHSSSAFTRTDYQRLLLVYLIPFILLVFSFTLVGHVSVLAVPAQAAIGLHVTAFALWVGSLYPLLLLSHSADVDALRLGMKRFGNFALGVVLVLVAAGIFLALQLFAGFNELIATRYGIGFLIKLLLVLCLLGIAAVNKLYLVPRLGSKQGREDLGRSIRLETVVATLVLVVTSYFTTLVGPAEH